MSEIAAPSKSKLKDIVNSLKNTVGVVFGGNQMEMQRQQAQQLQEQARVLKQAGFDVAALNNTIEGGKVIAASDERVLDYYRLFMRLHTQLPQVTVGISEASTIESVREQVAGQIKGLMTGVVEADKNGTVPALVNNKPVAYIVRVGKDAMNTKGIFQELLVDSKSRIFVKTAMPFAVRLGIPTVDIEPKHTHAT